MELIYIIVSRYLTKEKFVDTKRFFYNMFIYHTWLSSFSNRAEKFYVNFWDSLIYISIKHVYTIFHSCERILCWQRKRKVFFLLLQDGDKAAWANDLDIGSILLNRNPFLSHSFLSFFNGWQIVVIGDWLTTLVKFTWLRMRFRFF